MKYRVKFNCYWYNTGSADNHTYTKNKDFDTLAEAQEYQFRVNKQYELSLLKDRHSREEWEESNNYIEIENGFISGQAQIVKFTPEKEEAL